MSDLGDFWFVAVDLVAAQSSLHRLVVVVSSPLAVGGANVVVQAAGRAEVICGRKRVGQSCGLGRFLYCSEISGKVLQKLLHHFCAFFR